MTTVPHVMDSPSTEKSKPKKLPSWVQTNKSQSVFCFILVLVNPFFGDAKAVPYKLSENESYHAAFFLTFSWHSCSTGLGDRASRYLWSLEPLEGVTSGEAGKGCSNWVVARGASYRGASASGVRGDRSGRGKEKKTGSTYGSPLPIYMFCLGPA